MLTHTPFWCRSIGESNFKSCPIKDAFAADKCKVLVPHWVIYDGKR